MSKLIAQRGDHFYVLDSGQGNFVFNIDKNGYNMVNSPPNAMNSLKELLNIHPKTGKKKVQILFADDRNGLEEVLGSCPEAKVYSSNLIGNEILNPEEIKTEHITLRPIMQGNYCMVHIPEHKCAVASGVINNKSYKDPETRARLIVRLMDLQDYSLKCLIPNDGLILNATKSRLSDMLFQIAGSDIAIKAMVGKNSFDEAKMVMEKYQGTQKLDPDYELSPTEKILVRYGALVQADLPDGSMTLAAH
ncbi:MAG: hypothetical protein MAG795_00576 [Candidatus Woesearchaeota archaeon]|nr:hypothetical protein [Candidatus Woesearchaeota archaeon]